MLKYVLLCRLLDKKLYSISSLSAKVPSVYAVVQFYPWFKDCLYTKTKEIQNKN